MVNKHKPINPRAYLGSNVKWCGPTAVDPEVLAHIEAERGGSLSKKALRKLRRKLDNEARAKEARFWSKKQSAIQLGHHKPVNRQAAKDLSYKGPKKR